MIVLSAIQIHREIGPGVFESVYEELLAQELEQAGLHVQRQKRIDFTHRGKRFENAFCVDLLVNELVVVELKSIERLAPVHTKQLLTYLRLMNLRIGLLLNFNEYSLRQGIRRVINGFGP